MVVASKVPSGKFYHLIIYGKLAQHIAGLGSDLQHGRLVVSDLASASHRRPVHGSRDGSLRRFESISQRMGRQYLIIEFLVDGGLRGRLCLGYEHVVLSYRDG